MSKAKRTQENKYTKKDLEIMRAWTLERKIQVTQTRLMEWKIRFKGKIYISFSGGKDSTVLADLAARIYAADQKAGQEEQNPLTLVFVNTGLEYPEIQKFVKEFAEWLRVTYGIAVNLEILRPEISFPEVISTFGYPVISKDVSKRIYYAKKGSRWAINHLKGLTADGKTENAYASRFIKYNYLIDAPFNVSSHCCDVMKKRPAYEYSKKTGGKPVLATMTEESKLRENGWIKTGCNAFDSEHPASKPMSFWTEQDVLQYLKMTGIPYASVYGEIVTSDPQMNLFQAEPKKLVTTGCERTGCMYCMFGIMRDKEPNRFQRMKETHPRQYAYCIGGGHYENGCLKPDKNGLGLGVILDYIGKPY